MKRFSEQLNKKSKTLKLRVSEKRELRERVVSYMEYHPLPKEMKKAKAAGESKLLNEEYRVIRIPFLAVARWAAGVAMIVIIAVPIMAERSVPGDGLYAVKRFNEEVRGSLSFDTVQKVEWETELLNRRISEARLLASEGRLTDEAEAKVVEAVRSHSENAQKNIEVLRTQDADEATLASIAFETNLSVQSAALNDTEDETEEENETAEENEDRPSVLAALVEETRVKTFATNASSTIPAFYKVMAKVEINTTRAHELLDSLRINANTAQLNEVTRRLEDIERSVAEALELRDIDDETARKILIDSLQRIQKLIVFMTDIEVSQNVDIEEIVPVVLTSEEKQEILTNYQVELEKQIKIIQSNLDAIEDDGLAEKTDVILTEIEKIMDDFSTTDDFKTSKVNVLTALNLANNVVKLLEIDHKTVVPDVKETVSSSTDDISSSTDETTEIESSSTTKSSSTSETIE